ncbi:RloB family protein [Streptomyces abikoensis]|uniref:RloB family protein n=1 Tax=Streptomyces abikoensis TaxID=97398 RepID=UPI0033C331DC
MSKKNKDQEQKSSRRRRDRGAEGGGLRRQVDSYGDRSVRVIYVAAEGARTEPDYFELISKTYGNRTGREFQIKLCRPSHSNGLRPEEVVDFVLAGAKAQGGLDCEKWAFFDRDTKDNRDAEIPSAMRKAHQHGVQVGLSHPSFELWPLLHFEPFTRQVDGVSDAVLERLRSNRDAKGFEEYDRASGDRGKGLGGQRGQSLLGREKDAIRNARKLVTACRHGDCSPKNADLDAIDAKKDESYEDWRKRTGHAAGCDALQRDPSTDVWRLIASLDIGTEESQ